MWTFSAMAAQLNTVAATIYEDFIVKMMGVRVSDLTARIVMKSTVVVAGAVCVALVMVVEKLKGIVDVRLYPCSYMLISGVANSKKLRDNQN